MDKGTNVTELQIWSPWILTDEEGVPGDIPRGRAIRVGSLMTRSQAMSIAQSEMNKHPNAIAMMVRREDV